MSQGDNLFGKKTTYKKIIMRSRFETKIAYFLDCLKIKWEYEPKCFLLSEGMYYLPDFFLPELNMWIEAKGLIEEHNKEISRCFVKDNNTELLLIAPRETQWFSMKDYNEGICEDNEVFLGKCSHCGSYFFTSNLGWYFCRKCKAYEGDHDLLHDTYGEKSNTPGLFLQENIDFSDINSIKEGLEGYGVSI